MKNNFKLWFKCALIRAIKTMCQTALATIGTSVVLSEVNWLMVGSASLLSGILSILTSVAGLPELENIGEGYENIEPLNEDVEVVEIDDKNI